MKKFLLVLALTGLILSKAQAVNVNDIDAIYTGAGVVYSDSVALVTFAQKLVTLRDDGFVTSIAGSTQTVTVNNAQKQGLLAQYQNLKQKLQDDFQALP